VEDTVMNKPVCVVVGVGPGNGSAIARRFAAEGYAVALVARGVEKLADLERGLDHARAYACDVTHAEQVGGVFGQIEQEMGPASVLIYNAGSGHFKNFDETNAEEFEADWKINALGLLLTGKAVVPQMRRGRGGAIVVIGATASLTGNAGFAPFAAAKSAQRSLAQSMARHLDPEGIHVAYVIIDAIVDTPRAREMMPDRPDELFAKPEHIAEAVWFLSQQPKSAWTFELDLRPFGEHW
jgi:NAD(P)-dependent dehydrogenase (short-subunit alcohol dehydrogenase family)